MWCVPLTCRIHERNHFSPYLGRRKFRKAKPFRFAVSASGKPVLKTSVRTIFCRTFCGTRGRQWCNRFRSTNNANLESFRLLPFLIGDVFTYVFFSPRRGNLSHGLVQPPTAYSMIFPKPQTFNISRSPSIETMEFLFLNFSRNKSTGLTGSEKTWCFFKFNQLSRRCLIHWLICEFPIRFTDILWKNLL